MQIPQHQHQVEAVSRLCSLCDVTDEQHMESDARSCEKFQVLINICFFSIIGVFRPDIILKEELSWRLDQVQVNVLIRGRKWQLIGHTWLSHELKWSG